VRLELREDHGMGAEHDEPAHAAGVGVSLKRGPGALRHVLCHPRDVCVCAIAGDDDDPPANAGDHGLGVVVDKDLCPCADNGTATFKLILLQIGVGVGSLLSLNLGLLLLALLCLDQGRGLEAFLDLRINDLIGACAHLGIGLIEILFIGLCLLGTLVWTRSCAVLAFGLRETGAPLVPLRGLHLEDRGPRHGTGYARGIRATSVLMLRPTRLLGESHAEEKQ